LIVDYLNAIMGEGTTHNTSRGMQYSYCCPICNDYKQRLFFHPTKKVVKCHNCDYANSVITFMADYFSISWNDALKIYREYDGYEIALPDSIQDEIYQRLLTMPEIITEKYMYPLPEEFILVEEAKGKTGRKVIEYLRGRGVTLDMCQRYYIGYCEEGIYADRIIMTDFEQSELVYWQARTILPTPKTKAMKKLFRKVLNPSLTDEQKEQGIIAVDKSDVVSNIDFILETGMAVLCEGRMDAYTLLDYGGCLHGKSMSDAQFMKLVRNKDKIQTIAVMMDGDAFSSTLSIANRLYKHFDEVLVCKLPNDADPNSLGTKKCLEYLRDAIPYSPMFSVKARLKGWI
jgi:DNA primase